LDATVALYERQVFDESIFTQGIALTQLAYENGVKIGVGTDMSIDQFIQQYPGKSPEIIGQEQYIGSLSIGKQADILVVDKNPLLDISAIWPTKYVFKNGVLVSF